MLKRIRFTGGDWTRIWINNIKNMRKHLISYGDEKFAGQREFLRETAIASSFFDEIQIFSPEDIDPEFRWRIYNAIRFARGGGFWTWKVYFIKRVFESLKEDDILIYCDAGCMINGIARERFEQYIEMLAAAETGTLDFELPFKEYEYTKQEVFDYFRSPQEISNSNQLMATVILLKKCAHTSMLIDKWYNTVIDNVFLFTDDKRVEQRNGFIDHRHDQSVFSVIRKTYGAHIIPDETYFLDFLKEGANFPIWATRLRG